MADSKISQLTSGTVKATDLHVAVDTTDTSQSPTGTDKKYLWSALKTDAITGLLASANNLSDLNNATTARTNLGLAAGTATISVGSLTATSITDSGLTTGIVHSGSGGAFTSSAIVNADVDAAAAIVDTKLATISTAGKVSNSATTATNANTASAIVARDGSGNFSAGSITGVTSIITDTISERTAAAGVTIDGVLLKDSGATLPATTNQIILGTTNTTTINSTAPSASRVYGIPDFGAAASFVLTDNTTTTITKGTYTPTVGDGTNNFTMNRQEGWYVRIGDFVNFSVWVDWASKGSATGAIRISLPFNIAGVSFYRSAVYFGLTTGLVWTVAGKDTTLIGQLVTGSNYVQISGNPSDGSAGTAVLCSACLSTGSVILNGSYRTA